MSYGLRIENANGNLQIDSTYTDSGFIVTDYFESTTSVTYDRKNDFVFARPVATNQNISVGFNETTGTDTVTRNFTNTSNLVNMEVVVGRFSDQLTSASSGYGLQIFNSNGDLAFDSNQYNGDGGFGVTEYISPGSTAGTGDKVSNNGRLFAWMNQTYIGGGLFLFYTFKDDGTDDGIFWTGQVGQAPFNQNIGNLNPIYFGERGSV